MPCAVFSRPGRGARESCPCIVGLRLLSCYSNTPGAVLDLRSEVLLPPLPTGYHPQSLEHVGEQARSEEDNEQPVEATEHRATGVRSEGNGEATSCGCFRLQGRYQNQKRRACSRDAYRFQC